MFSRKHYSNIFAIILIAISSGLIFIRFASLYIEHPISHLILYLFFLTVGVFALDFAAGKIKPLNGYKQPLVLFYLIVVLLACALFIIKTGVGEPNNYLAFLKSYLVTGILYAALIFIASEMINNEKINLMAIVIALLLGALHLLANALIIPSIIFALYFFRNNLKNLFLFAALSAAAFLILNYFLIENGTSFSVIARAPLTNIPLIWKIIIVIISIYVGWSAASLNEVFISGAFFLCLMSMISIVILIQTSGFENALLVSEPFIVTLIPMALFLLSNYKVDRFLGRVMPIHEQVREKE